MAARSVLLISDAAAPLILGEAPLGVMGLARALGAGGITSSVLSLADPEAAGRVPGLARRLRTVKVRTGELTRDVALFEGKAPLSQSQMIVAGAEGRNRGESALLLAETVRSLADDGLLKADVAVAWGETAALALSVVSAGLRLFVVPSGRLGGPMSVSEETAVAAAGIEPARSESRSFAAIGAGFANAIVAPSASAARLLEEDPGLADRASDEPLVVVRFGCDDPPNDPATDPALPATFSSKSLAGKLECRRVVTRRYSLALGPRTLLLGSGQLRHGKCGNEVLAALAAFSRLDVVVLIPSEGDSDLLERARRLAIQSPGRLAVLDEGDAQERILRAAADAVLCADPDDRTGRASGLAQRYGALPIAADIGASRDYLVDYDPASATGSAILFGAANPHEIEGAVRRALALRADADRFAPLVQRLMEAAPRWSQTARAFDEICASLS